MMFTVCPKCTLTLAVTAGDLRAGQGYVRCGRCANVFNALIGLSEESDAPAKTSIESASGTASRPILTMPDATDDSPSPPPTAPIAPTPSAAKPAPAPALRLIESPPRPLPTPMPADAAEKTWNAGEYHATGNYQTIVLEGDTFLQTEEMIPEEALDNEIADVSRRISAAHAAAQGVGTVGTHAVIEITSDDFRLEPPLQASVSAVEQLRHAPRARARASWPLRITAVLLVVLLITQALMHWRDDLATRSGWYEPMSRVADVLGQPLRPNWNLGGYDVRQLGAAADNVDSHALRVRLSLANTGTQRLGMPLLRLTLLDRYGKALSRSDLAPLQYLPASLRGQQFLLREQRIDTEVRVLDPSQQASSFELDVCVPATGGTLRCASDTNSVASPS